MRNFLPAIGTFSKFATQASRPRRVATTLGQGLLDRDNSVGEQFRKASSSALVSHPVPVSGTPW